MWFPGTMKLNDMLLDRYLPDASVRKDYDILDGMPFSGFSINIGPKALAAKHRDSSNVVNGLCTIAVFGDFTPTLSGHVILHSARIILEVFPGNLYHVLSSNIPHENIRFVKKDKNCRRQSFVHYTAGTLFQWLWDGRQKHKDVLAADPEAEARDSVEGLLRFKELYDLLPTLDDLNDAIKSGKLSDHGIEQRILEGKSHMMHAENP